MRIISAQDEVRDRRQALVRPPPYPGQALARPPLYTRQALHRPKNGYWPDRTDRNKGTGQTERNMGTGQTEQIEFAIGQTEGVTHFFSRPLGGGRTWSVWPILVLGRGLPSSFETILLNRFCPIFVIQQLS